MDLSGLSRICNCRDSDVGINAKYRINYGTVRQRRFAFGKILTLVSQCFPKSSATGASESVYIWERVIIIFMPYSHAVTLVSVFTLLEPCPRNGVSVGVDVHLCNV